MATGRMINKKISLNKAVNDLSCDTSRLAFTWTIPHLDRDGRIHGDPTVLKSIVFPRRQDISVVQMEEFIKEWVKAGLVIWYEAEGDLWIQFPKFAENQKGMRYDKETSSGIPSPEDGKIINVHDTEEGRTKGGNSTELVRSEDGVRTEIVRTKDGISTEEGRTKDGVKTEKVRLNRIEKKENRIEYNNISDAKASAGKPANKETQSQDNHEKNKTREAETTVEPRNDYEKVECHYSEAHQELYGFVPEINYGQTRKLLRQRFKKHTSDEILALIDQAKNDPWILKNKAFDLPTILSSQVMNRLMRMARASPHDGGWENLPEKLDPLKMPEWLAEEVTDGI